MKKFIFILCLFGLLFVQADDIENVSKEQWMSDLSVLVQLTDPVKSKNVVNDKNKNGVRDDVENYVLSKYKNRPFQRDIFFDAAKKIEKIISLPLKGRIDDHIKLDRELISIYTCRDYILYRNNSKNIKKEMLNKTLFKAKVLNTPERLKAYIEHKKLLPLDFDDLTQEELNREKKRCLQRYYSYEESKEIKNTSLIIK